MALNLLPFLVASRVDDWFVHAQQQERTHMVAAIVDIDGEPDHQQV
jgi:P2-related tail formation protein